MSRGIGVEWPEFGVTVSAVLLEDKAPKICQFIWDRLPIKSIQVHGLLGGCWIYGPSDITSLAGILPVRENIRFLTDMEPGCVGFSGDGGINIVYGEMSEPAPMCNWAKIRDEDIDRLKNVGSRMWENTMRPYASAEESSFSQFRKRVISVRYMRKG